MVPRQIDRAQLVCVRIIVCTIVALLLVAAFTIKSTQAQSLEQKLETATDYVPTSTEPVDQLIEVARKFKIPMGIEWLERESKISSGTPLTPGKRSVRELIAQIMSVSPEHRVEVANGLVRIYSPNASIHPLNFLNIRLENYFVDDGDLFAAEDQLRWAIRFTLEPQKYKNGYGGGYGHAGGDVFQFPQFTLSGSDVTVREILNQIALAQGNALWVARIKSKDLQGHVPYWNRLSVDEGEAPVTSAWHFIHLSEIGELATESIVIDVKIGGLLDQRMTTIPVMLDHGLVDSSGGATGGVSSDGISYRYAASVEDLNKAFATLSVHLQVGRSGEAEFNFDQKLEVHKDRITEVHPESRITIRAYFEPAQKP
jgi:hypothetical protein